MQRTRSTPSSASTNNQRSLFKHVKEPWEYVVIDNFLSPERWQTIKNLAAIELEKYEHWSADEKIYFNKANKPRNKYTSYLEEDILPECNDLFFNLDLPHRGYQGKLKKILHWAISPPHWYYPTHIDNRSRISTSILYVSPDESDGTVIARNPSTNDDGDHIAADQEDHYNYMTDWKPNSLFFHNPIPNVSWHAIKNTTDKPRVTLNSFYVQPDLVTTGRCYSDYILDI